MIWEYKQINIYHEKLKTTLNELGKEGWEAVCLLNPSTLLMKRSKI